MFAAIQASVGIAGLLFGRGAENGYGLPLYGTLTVSVLAAILILLAGRYPTTSLVDVYHAGPATHGPGVQPVR